MSQRGDCPMSFRDPDFFYLAVLFPWILGVLFTYRKSKESLGEVAVVRSVSGAHSFHLHPVDQNSAARSSHLNTGKERVWPGGREDEYPWGVVGLLQIYNLTSSKCVMLCYATSLQSCLTLCDPMACSPPGSLGALSMGFSRQEYWQEYMPFSKCKLPQRACGRQNDGLQNHVLTLRISEDITFMQKRLCRCD